MKPVEIKSLNRFVRVACGVGLLLAYSLVVPLYSYGLLPSGVTWLGVAVTPLLLFGTVFAATSCRLESGRLNLRLLGLGGFTYALAVFCLYVQGWM